MPHVRGCRRGPALQKGDNISDYRVTVTKDRPFGMWHTGPTACWVEVEHLSTGIRARAYSDSQIKARQRALACVEMMLDDEPGVTPEFIERLAAIREGETK